MKKLLSIIMIIFFASAFVFADEEGDDYDDGYVYEANTPGDQFIKMEINGFFPLNFNKQLKPGASANVNYFTFIANDFALGGGLSLSTCLSIGNKSFIMIPFTFSAMYQPTFGKFEFPIEMHVGFAVHTMASHTYFPALYLRGNAGIFYRISEAWSVGASGSYAWTPEWCKDPSKNYNGTFATGGLSVRFHF